MNLTTCFGAYLRNSRKGLRLYRERKLRNLNYTTSSDKQVSGVRWAVIGCRWLLCIVSPLELGGVKTANNIVLTKPESSRT